MYLCALSKFKRERSQVEILNYLDRVVEKQLNNIKALAIGVPFYTNVEPDLLISVTRMYLQFSPNEPLTLGQPLPTVLKQAKDALQPLVNSCPAHKEPLYLMAYVKYLSGDGTSAIRLLQKCLEHNHSFSDGHLLMAKILLFQGNFQTASQSLEIALSHNFQVQ